MVQRLLCLAVLTLAPLLATACGDDHQRPEATAPATTVGQTTRGPEVPGATLAAPPEVRLTWLPGGVLGLENADARPVSLARELTLQAGDSQEPAQLPLGLECAPRPSTDHDGRACLTLVPGAALAIGRWPDDHGVCRCPPCVEVAAGSSVVIHTCDGGHALSRSLPER